MSSPSTIIPVTDSNVIFICPTNSLLGVWTLGNDGAYRMDTKGNDCSMQYSFTATGVSVNILGNWDHGVYSCQLDDGSPQWFNANTATIGYAVGCAVSGLANEKHTLKITNAPMSGWWLTLENITLTTGDAYTGAKTFTSGWAAYQLPPTLASQESASTVTAVTTVTASGSDGGQVPVAALASVAAVLGTLFVGAAIAAVYFWVRDSRFRRDHQWSQAISAAPVAYTTELSPPIHNTEFNPQSMFGPGCFFLPIPTCPGIPQSSSKSISTDILKQRHGMKSEWGFMERLTSCSAAVESGWYTTHPSSFTVHIISEFMFGLAPSLLQVEVEVTIDLLILSRFAPSETQEDRYPYCANHML